MAYDVFERRHEIIVAGAGLCGLAAALAARRAGRQVLLVERRGTIGWEISWAFQHELSPTAADAADSLAAELYGRLEARGAARDGRCSPAAAELEMFQMLEEAGVELLLGAVPLAPVAEEGRVCGLLVGGKSGQHLLSCDLLIDATDNLLLSREMGLPVATQKDPGGILSVMLNCLPKVPQQTLSLGSVGKARQVTVTPGVFSGEARLSLTIDRFDMIEACLALPEVLAAMRREPALQLALVTGIGPDLLPAAATHRLKPDPQSLGESFLVAHVGTQGDATGSVAARLALGTRIGRQAAGQWQPSKVCLRAAVGSLLARHPRETADVVVAGGGTSGPLAAIAAARQGASVILLESMTYLGGMATGGGIHNYYHGITGGLQDEIDRRVAELAPLFVGDTEIVGRSSDGLLTGFHPDGKKIALLELAVKAGVKVRFETTMTGVLTEPLRASQADEPQWAMVRHHPGRTGKGAARVTAVLAADGEGIHTYAGKAFIDSTGDGDLAAMAGAGFIFGRDGDGLLHAFSQSCGRLAPVKDDSAASSKQPQAAAARPKMVIVNFDAGYCDPDDITDLTRARQLGLTHLRKDRWSDDDRWTYIAPHIGLRQGRQIIGDYQLTLGDEIRGETFPDVIAYAQSHYDNHARDYEHESDAAVLWAWLLGQWRTPYGCEIPYRSLLPRNIDGLLVACRAVAVTQDAHYQLRMQRDMQRLGEAAGIAAALAARAGVSPRDVDIQAVQAELRKVGALDQSQRPKPATLQQPSAELARAAIGGDGKAIWQAAFEQGEALPTVRQGLQSNLPAERFWSAVTLAVTGDASGAAELRAAVAERRCDAPQARNAAAQWQGAAVMLGRLRDRQAVPLLADVLSDPTVSLSGVLAAVRSLGRIGDAAAAPAIRQLLDRADLETDRPMSGGVPQGKRVVEPARWQFDLTAAEALARIGQPATEIVEKYLKDERAYVRRYARRILETQPAQ